MSTRSGLTYFKLNQKPLDAIFMQQYLLNYSNHLMQYYSCPYIIHECSEKILNLANYGSINIHSHYTILCNACLWVCAEIFQNIPNYSWIFLNIAKDGAMHV